jgi:hypothetical protein
VVSVIPPWLLEHVQIVEKQINASALLPEGLWVEWDTEDRQ